MQKFFSRIPIVALLFGAEIRCAQSKSPFAPDAMPSPDFAQAIVILMERRYQNQISRVESYQATREFSATSLFLSKPAIGEFAETFTRPGTRTLQITERQAPGYLDQLSAKFCEPESNRRSS